METLKVRNIEVCGTNYEIGYENGKSIVDIPEVRESQINKSNALTEEEEKYMMELFDKYCPGLNEELQG
ncbi:acyl-CoA--6-aminopenicillanic acid acyltransferase, partial [Clostridioides difficile]